MAQNTGGSANQLIDRLMNDAQFRESLEAAPTSHAKAEVVKAAGYGDVSVEALQEALKKQLAAVGAGVQGDPARVKRVEELFRKAATDQELQQALRAAATPEAKRDVLTQAGYGDITLDDLRAAAADLAQREELGDEELEQVSGGGEISRQAWLSSMMPMMAASAGLGMAVGGPIGGAVGAVVGMAASIVGAFAIPDPPPISDW